MRYLILAALFLTGCATTPEPDIVTKEVRIPIPVPCVERKDIPPIPVIDKVTKETPDGEKIAAVVIHRERLIIHSGELESLLVSCVE